MGSRGKGRKKKGLPVFESDRDLYRAFIQKEQAKNPDKESDLQDKSGKPQEEKPALNKHGLPIIREMPRHFSQAVEKPDPKEDNFEDLLDQSLKSPLRKKNESPRPMPLKKRLKRYPGPEKELDLHGFTALGAKVRARSFIGSCKQQGYFTVRIIVGKGLHSDLGPVLPDAIEDLLTELKKENLVLSFQWDRKKKSRSGAVIVYIKQFSD